MYNLTATGSTQPYQQLTDKQPSIEPIEVADTQAQILDSLAVIKHSTPVFEAAEKLSDPESDPNNGLFAGASIWTLASMTPEANEWMQIEQQIGRVVPMDERSAAIDAATVLKNNWQTVYDAAPALGLSSSQDSEGMKNLLFDAESIAAVTPAEIENALADGQVDPFRQGNLGDCFVLSALTALNNTAEGRTLIADAIQQTADGGWMVSFAGSTPPSQYSVSAQDLADYPHSIDDIDMQIFEVALEKHANTTGFNGGTITSGGWGADVVQLLGGPVATELDPRTPGFADELIAMAQKPAFSALFDASANFENGGTSDLHAYTLISADPNTREVQFSNPWNSQELIRMPVDQFVSSIRSFWALTGDSTGSAYAMDAPPNAPSPSTPLYYLSKHTSIEVDANRLIGEGQQIWARLQSGQGITQQELELMESSAGSENLFSGDDIQTWLQALDVRTKG